MCRSAAELLAWLEGFEELAQVAAMWPGDSVSSTAKSQSNQQSFLFSQLYETCSKACFVNKLSRVHPVQFDETSSQVPDQLEPTKSFVSS